MTVGFVGGKFLPFHQGHVYMIMAAAGMVDKLYVVLSSSPNRDKELCERDGIKYMPAEVRMSWIGESLNDLENIEVINVVDDSWDHDYDWEDGANKIKAAIPEDITHVFSSEHEYDEYFKEYYPGAKHVVIDEGRDIVNISATELRLNLYDNWHMLPHTVKAFFVKKVVVVGSESCGKSTLVKKLAKFYNTKYVPETGREYCEKYKNQLTVPMFNSIAMDHFRRQEEYATESNKFLFVDSEAITTLFYLDMYFKEKSDFIKSITKLQEYDLVLLLRPDVKWVDDGIRFAGDDEVRIDNHLTIKNMMCMYGLHDFIEISGDYSERFNIARKYVDKLLKNDSQTDNLML